MGVLLGLDLGEKRVGVAVTDEMGMLATPLLTLEYVGKKKFVVDLSKLIAEYNVEKIIVGLPKTLKGEMGPAAQKISAQVGWFKTQVQIPWIFWDERLTSAEVERVLIDADVSREKRKDIRDRLAAQRILQNYLDFQRHSQA